MNNIDMVFADDNEIIIDSLIAKIREQSENLDSAEEKIEHLANRLNQEQQHNARLVMEIAILKQEAKESKTPKAVKDVANPKKKVGRSKKPVVTDKRKPGRPKKIVVTAKRKPGRPKKVVK
jgi:nicotinamide mononucleotide adenylyltransferase